MKITSGMMSTVEANYDQAFIRVCADEEVAGLGESFPRLPQEGICHGC